MDSFIWISVGGWVAVLTIGFLAWRVMHRDEPFPHLRSYFKKPAKK